MWQSSVLHMWRVEGHPNPTSYERDDACEAFRKFGPGSLYEGVKEKSEPYRCEKKNEK
jgi:hypothetical protein